MFRKEKYDKLIAKAYAQSISADGVLNTYFLVEEQANNLAYFVSNLNAVSVKSLQQINDKNLHCISIQVKKYYEVIDSTHAANHWTDADIVELSTAIQVADFAEADFYAQFKTILDDRLSGFANELNQLRLLQTKTPLDTILIQDIIAENIVDKEFIMALTSNVINFCMIPVDGFGGNILHEIFRSKKIDVIGNFILKKNANYNSTLNKIAFAQINVSNRTPFHQFIHDNHDIDNIRYLTTCLNREDWDFCLNDAATLQALFFKSIDFRFHDLISTLTYNSTAIAEKISTSSNVIITPLHLAASKFSTPNFRNLIKNTTANALNIAGKIINHDKHSLVDILFLNKTNPEILKTCVIELFNKIDDDTLKFILANSSNSRYAFIFLDYEKTPAALSKRILACSQLPMFNHYRDYWLEGNDIPVYLADILLSYTPEMNCDRNSVFSNALKRILIDYKNKSQINYGNKHAITAGNSRYIELNFLGREDNINHVWQHGLASWQDYYDLRMYLKNQMLYQQDIGPQLAKINYILATLKAADKIIGGAKISFEEYLHFPPAAEEFKTFVKIYSHIQQHQALIKMLREDNFADFAKQLSDYSYRPKLRKTFTAAEEANAKHKLIHLTNEIIAYESHKYKVKTKTYAGLKKHSFTLLSRGLVTRIFGQQHDDLELVGILFNYQACLSPKGFFRYDTGTHPREWVGDEVAVKAYQAKMKHYLFKNYAEFIQHIESQPVLMNEILARVTREACLAIVIAKVTPKAIEVAKRYQIAIQDIIGFDIPIINYDNKSQQITLHSEAKPMLSRVMAAGLTFTPTAAIKNISLEEYNAHLNQTSSIAVHSQGVIRHYFSTEEKAQAFVTWIQCQPDLIALGSSIMHVKSTNPGFYCEVTEAQFNAINRPLSFSDLTLAYEIIGAQNTLPYCSTGSRLTTWKNILSKRIYSNSFNQLQLLSNQVLSDFFASSPTLTPKTDIAEVLELMCPAVRSKWLLNCNQTTLTNIARFYNVESFSIFINHADKTLLSSLLYTDEPTQFLYTILECQNLENCLIALAALPAGALNSFINNENILKIAACNNDYRLFMYLLSYATNADNLADFNNLYCENSAAGNILLVKLLISKQTMPPQAIRAFLESLTESAFAYFCKNVFNRDLLLLNRLDLDSADFPQLTAKIEKALNINLSAYTPEANNHIKDNYLAIIEAELKAHQRYLQNKLQTHPEREIERHAVQLATVQACLIVLTSGNDQFLPQANKSVFVYEYQIDLMDKFAHLLNEPVNQIGSARIRLNAFANYYTRPEVRLTLAKTSNIFSGLFFTTKKDQLCQRIDKVLKDYADYVLAQKQNAIKITCK